MEKSDAKKVGTPEAKTSIQLHTTPSVHNPPPRLLSSKNKTLGAAAVIPTSEVMLNSLEVNDFSKGSHSSYRKENSERLTESWRHVT